MNASRLLEIVQLLIEVEKKNRIQTTLSTLNAALTNLVSQPSQSQYQNDFANSLGVLDNLLKEARERFQPAQITLLKDIGASEYFIADIAAEISSWVAQNVATPAVAQQKLENFISERDMYITQIKQLHQNLDFIGIEVSRLEPGQAEIGFLLPRDLFDNDFDQFLKELNVIKGIIRAFSEVVTGSVEPIEVREISTSDPLFFLSLDPATIAMIGAAITWALNTWKQVEEIRQVRAQTAKIDALKGEPIGEIFEDTIKKIVKKSVERHTDEIASKIDDKKGRKNEQETHIKWALESIISRVERGMTVEIRLLPPPAIESEEGKASSAEKNIYEELSEVAHQLVFPKMEGTPIFELPPSDPDPVPHKAARKAE